MSSAEKYIAFLIIMGFCLIAALNFTALLK